MAMRAVQDYVAAIPAIPAVEAIPEIPAVPAVLDEEDNVVTPAVPYQYAVPGHDEIPEVPEILAYVAQEGEVLFEDYATDEQLAKAFPGYAAAKSQEEIKAQIAALEIQQTPRRLREMLKDPTWMDALDAQIVALRAQLT